jgi:hypothetical protein
VICTNFVQGNATGVKWRRCAKSDSRKSTETVADSRSGDGQAVEERCKYRWFHRIPVVRKNSIRAKISGKSLAGGEANLGL